MTKPEFIFFDIDDTILDHANAQQQALISVHEKYPCLHNTNPDEFRKAFKKVNIGLWHRYSLGEIDRPYLEKHRFTDTFELLGIPCKFSNGIVQFFMDDYRNHWQWISGARESLEQLSQKFRIGFITNGFSEVQKQKAIDFNLDSFSDVLIISEDVGYLKPHPKIFEHAQTKAGVNPEKILYVGDSFSSDVAGSKNVGWNVAWYSKEDIPNEGIQPDFQFDVFSDLTDFFLNRS